MKNYNTYKDIQLVSLIREEKELSDQAFYVLYNRYATKLNAYCLFKFRNKAESEEIFHAVWIKFFKTVKAGTDVENVLPYLIKIANSISIDMNRSANKKRTPDIDYFSEEQIVNLNIGGEPNNDMEDNELIHLIKIAVETLDDKYKEAFVLKRFNDLSYEEISEITNENISNIKKRIYRATNMVKNILKPYINELSDV